jgi:hypothetical protein
MLETTELHARLLADARNYDPAAHNRGLLGPYRDVLLLWRAKFMSYEQIAATLTKHGIKVSPAGVGVFCRRNFSKAEIERARHQTPGRTGSPLPAPAPSGRAAEATGARRGPRVARDDY